MPSKSIPVTENGKILFFLINYHIYSTNSINKDLFWSKEMKKKHKMKFIKIFKT